MSDKIWYAVEVEIARVGETAATTQLWAFNTTGVEISEDANNPDFITLRAYFNSAPDTEKIREQILRNLKLIDLPEFALRGIRVEDVFDKPAGQSAPCEDGDEGGTGDVRAHLDDLDDRILLALKSGDGKRGKGHTEGRRRPGRPGQVRIARKPE